MTRALPNSGCNHVTTHLSHTVPQCSGSLSLFRGPSGAQPVQTHSGSFMPEQRITSAKFPFSFCPHPALSIWNLPLSHLCHKFSLKPLIHHVLMCTLLYSCYLNTQAPFKHHCSHSYPPCTPFSFAPLYTPSHLPWPPALTQPCSHMLSNMERLSKKRAGYAPR